MALVQSPALPYNLGSVQAIDPWYCMLISMYCSNLTLGKIDSDLVSSTVLCRLLILYAYTVTRDQRAITSRCLHAIGGLE